jgi:hypothetical protein
LKSAYGAEQEKFFASSVLPVPEYFATCGNGHNGRVIAVSPVPRAFALRVATINCMLEYWFLRVADQA